MMSFRYFALLSALVLFAIITNAALAEESESSVEETKLGNSLDLEDAVEARNPLLVAIIRIIGAAVKWAAKHCLIEAAHHCRQYWNNPKALVQCSKEYLHANKGRCWKDIVE